MKEPFIEIVDAKGGFRVRSIAKNGEVLQTSEVLESSAAVNKHLLAMYNLWNVGMIMCPDLKIKTAKYKPSKTVKDKFLIENPPKK